LGFFHMQVVFGPSRVARKDASYGIVSGPGLGYHGGGEVGDTDGATTRKGMGLPGRIVSAALLTHPFEFC